MKVKPFALRSLLPILAAVAIIGTYGQSSAIPAGSSLEVSIPEAGAVLLATGGNPGILETGYAALLINSGSAPYGTAVFSFRQNNVVVSEAGVPASPPSRSSRIFIDFRENVPFPPGRPAGNGIRINTGLAVVNYSSGLAGVSFTLRDLSGNILSTGYGLFDPGVHQARFIDGIDVMAPTFNLPGDFETNIRFGTLDVIGDRPIAVLALRMATNQRGESIYTTTPTVDLARVPDVSPAYFPQFVDGGGYSTSLTLVNTSGSTETGTLSIFDDSGASLEMTSLEGTTASSFRYSIPVHGAFRFQSDGAPATARSGWVLLTPDPGTSTPASAGVFSYSSGGILVTESGIPSALPASHARIYADLSGGHNTGLAVANLTGAPMSLSLTAAQIDGSVVPGTGPASWQVPGNGHSARFIDQLVPGLPSGFTGVVEISSPTAFAALTLRSLVNERSDFLMTTFPTAEDGQPPPALMAFPHVADGGGYRTEFIVLSGAGSATATLNLFDEKGQPWLIGR